MGHKIGSHDLVYGTLFLLLATASFAQAQTEVKPFVNAYRPDYFVSSHPSSAYEMVGLLPSFQLTEGDTTVRGYAGSIGNVLIDGRPPTSKDETLQTILKRIPPESVERVEVIRTGAAGYDFLGFPMLANVILKANSAPKVQVSLEDSFLRHGHSFRIGTARMSWGTTDVLDLTFTASNTGPNAMAGYGTRFVIDPSNVTVRKDTYIINRVDDVWNITGGYRQPLLGGEVHLTGLYNELRTFAPLVDNEYFPVVSASPGGDTEFKDDSEVGIQYSHPLWTGAEGEADLLRRAESDFHPQTAYVGTVQQVASTTAHSSETILHSVLRQQLAPGLSFDGTLDATLNQLENLVKLAKGGVNIPLPAAQVHILEQRGEGTSNLTWQATSALTIEGGIRYEMSRMKQTGDSNLTRVFGYLKPRVKASYKLNGQNIVRLLVTREAGQLNFQNFVTTVETKVNQVNGGNKNLIPQTLWEAELSWEHAFKGGSLVLTGRHELLSATVDNVAISGVAGLFNAQGNIGGGRIDQVQANLVSPLDWAVPGLTVQGNFLYTTSSVKDPQTHVRRSISGPIPWTGKIALTQDLPEWHARLGASYTWAIGQNAWRFNEFQEKHSLDPQTEIFAEYKPAPAWLLRTYVRNVLDTPNLTLRQIWVGDRGTTPYSYLEDRRTGYGPSVGFYAQYDFGL
jgi:hypothetical protein